MLYFKFQIYLKYLDTLLQICLIWLSYSASIINFVPKQTSNLSSEKGIKRTAPYIHLVANCIQIMVNVIRFAVFDKIWKKKERDNRKEWNGKQMGEKLLKLWFEAIRLNLCGTILVRNEKWKLNKLYFASGIYESAFNANVSKCQFYFFLHFWYYNYYIQMF